MQQPTDRDAAKPDLAMQQLRSLLSRPSAVQRLVHSQQLAQPAGRGTACVSALPFTALQREFRRGEDGRPLKPACDASETRAFNKGIRACLVAGAPLKRIRVNAHDNQDTMNAKVPVLFYSTGDQGKQQALLKLLNTIFNGVSRLSNRAHALHRNAYYHMLMVTKVWMEWQHTLMCIELCAIPSAVDLVCQC